MDLLQKLQDLITQYKFPIGQWSKDLIGWLQDNFEWFFGYRPTFGLIAVDRATQDRTVKPSARWLAGSGNSSVWRGRRLGYFRLLHGSHQRKSEGQPR